ncbi:MULTISPECIES: FG-GAP-like repeat-containing protein [unclassified Streptomyces]|uniref:FG-GAP-like repeat-containing protein n=1 Tax=unclassified Streptomyces TaxID=2593676 RepID=UPI002155FF5A|nr:MULTISPECIES: FG-GAP-like repeat-containing protein [unclassified Streptomyces]
MQAAESGERTEVLSQRSETTQVFANPDGTLTQDTYALPQWVRQGKKLAEIDTTLQHRSNGRYAARATEIGVAFSGGGNGPLVTVDKDGRSMSWSWPGELPRPTVNADTATYSEVLPGVDLKLKAGSAGFSQLLVVKNAEAAANPELKRIAFELDSTGLDIGADDHGNLRATNPAGQEVFTAPTPLMWDSSSPTMPATRSTGTPPPPADEFEVPYGAKDAAMDLQVRGNELTLAPDTELLTGEETRYPVYIDPSVSGSRYAWTIAYKKYPNSSFYNGNGWKNSDGSYGTSTARAGYENMTNGLARSYFRMRTANLWSTDKVISSSTFRIKNSWSWSCTAKPVELWRTAAIGSSTTWNNRPTRREKMDTVNDAKGWSSSCPAGNLAFDVTKGAKDAAANEWNTITLELAASNESDVYGWKRFDAKTASLSTTYNTRPKVPSGLDTYPVSTNNEYGCGDKAPYKYIGNTDFYLRAKVTDSDNGSVKAVFHLWPTGHRDDGLIIDKTVSVSSGTVASLKVSKALLAQHAATAGGNFSWKVKADDGSLSSDWNPTLGAPGCRFVFDADRASTPPTITSALFPDGSDGWPVTTGSVRQKGTFALGAAGVSDIVAYDWWTDTDTTRRNVKNSSAGGSASIDFTPTVAGANQMYVQSLDPAGNRSDTAVYLFYAKGVAKPDTAGDLNGDGNADLWAIDGSDTLHRYYGAGDGTVTDATSTASNSTWPGAQITHRGDWTGDGYEDLVALRPAAGTDPARLWMHPNNGFGFACTNCAGGVVRQELKVYDQANNHWSSGAKQILAVGDLDGGLDTDGDGVEDVPGHPDLMVNDGEFIWLYYGAPDNYLDSYRDPVLLAGPDDPISYEGTPIKDVTLAAPGDFTGDGVDDLVVRYEPADTTGLYVFHGNINEWGEYDTSLSERTVLSWDWGIGAKPLITAAPDADNNGVFDMWATTPGSGRLRYYADFTAQGPTDPVTASDSFAGYRSIG